VLPVVRSGRADFPSGCPEQSEGLQSGSMAPRRQWQDAGHNRRTVYWPIRIATALTPIRTLNKHTAPRLLQSLRSYKRLRDDSPRMAERSGLQLTLATNALRAMLGLFFIARAGEEAVGVMRSSWTTLTGGVRHIGLHPHACRAAGVDEERGLDRAAVLRPSTYSSSRTSCSRLDCVADRLGLRNLYEDFGFSLHSVVQRGPRSFAWYGLQPTR
jgi:hypothetical protein